MKRLSLSAILLTMGLFAEAHAVGRLADVSVIDRDSGCALATHYYRGEYWVAGSPGARYAIAIRNRLGERVLAVTSVDGINVVSGATAGWGQTGYVFGAGEDYRITGWRKSDADVAAFAFTPSPNSYAERTGRPANVGIIGVALFRERLAAVVPESPAAAKSARGAFEARDRRGRQQVPLRPRQLRRGGQLREKLRQHCISRLSSPRAKTRYGTWPAREFLGYAHGV